MEATVNMLSEAIEKGVKVSRPLRNGLYRGTMNNPDLCTCSYGAALIGLGYNLHKIANQSDVGLREIAEHHFGESAIVSLLVSINDDEPLKEGEDCRVHAIDYLKRTRMDMVIIRKDLFTHLV